MVVLFSLIDSYNIIICYQNIRFSTLPAVISDNLQPVVLRITRPSFVNINISVLGSKRISEVFWFFFVPFTKFEYK